MLRIKSGLVTCKSKRLSAVLLLQSFEALLVDSVILIMGLKLCHLKARYYGTP